MERTFLFEPPEDLIHLSFGNAIDVYKRQVEDVIQKSIHMLVTCKLSEAVMCHTLMQQGTLDVRFPPGKMCIRDRTELGEYGEGSPADVEKEREKLRRLAELIKFQLNPDKFPKVKFGDDVKLCLLYTSRCV